MGLHWCADTLVFMLTDGPGCSETAFWYCLLCLIMPPCQYDLHDVQTVRAQSLERRPLFGSVEGWRFDAAPFGPLPHEATIKDNNENNAEMSKMIKPNFSRPIHPRLN